MLVTLVLVTFVARMTLASFVLLVTIPVVVVTARFHVDFGRGIGVDRILLFRIDVRDAPDTSQTTNDGGGDQPTVRCMTFAPGG